MLSRKDLGLRKSCLSSSHRHLASTHHHLSPTHRHLIVIGMLSRKDLGLPKSRLLSSHRHLASTHRHLSPTHRHLIVIETKRLGTTEVTLVIIRPSLNCRRHTVTKGLEITEVTLVMRRHSYKRTWDYGNHDCHRHTVMQGHRNEKAKIDSDTVNR